MIQSIMIDMNVIHKLIQNTVENNWILICNTHMKYLNSGSLIALIGYKWDEYKLKSITVILFCRLWMETNQVEKQPRTKI